MRYVFLAWLRSRFSRTVGIRWTPKGYHYYCLWCREWDPWDPKHAGGVCKEKI